MPQPLKRTIRRREVSAAMTATLAKSKFKEETSDPYRRAAIRSILWDFMREMEPHLKITHIFPEREPES